MFPQEFCSFFGFQQPGTEVRHPICLLDLLESQHESNSSFPADIQHKSFWEVGTGPWKSYYEQLRAASVSFMCINILRLGRTVKKNWHMMDTGFAAATCQNILRPHSFGGTRGTWLFTTLPALQKKLGSLSQTWTILICALDRFATSRAALPLCKKADAQWFHGLKINLQTIGQNFQDASKIIHNTGVPEVNSQMANLVEKMMTNHWI